MIFQASRRRPLSGNKALVVVALVLGVGSVSFSAPIIQTNEAGTVDWTTGMIRVVGVGTPRVLSALAGVTDSDLSRAADVDGHSRLSAHSRPALPTGA